MHPMNPIPLTHLLTSLRFAAIWERPMKQSGESWVARYGMTDAQYQQELNRYVDQEYQLVHVVGYTLNKNQGRYAAVYEGSVEQRARPLGPGVGLWGG